MTVRSLLKCRAFVVLKPLKGCIGTRKGRLVELDPRGRHNLARVMLHELIHVRYPNMGEDRVLYWEARLWEGITHRQALALYERVFGGC